MTTKRFNGKAIYQPTGKAAEYSAWACNFFTGCSNNCEYCYCKRGVMSHVWSTKPQLKRCFKDEMQALDIFEHELKRNLEPLRKWGLLFSFTTDPMLPEIRTLTIEAAGIALSYGVPVQILTKCTEWLYDENFRIPLERSYLWIFKKHLIAFGFTLTGFDEQEPGASTNDERIEAMRELHGLGIKTFASIEPIITPAMSRNMIEATRGFCDLYKVGVISGKGKDFYNWAHMTHFWDYLADKMIAGHKIYIKDSLLDYLKIKRENLASGWINSDYNIFNSETE